MNRRNKALNFLILIAVISTSLNSVLPVKVLGAEEKVERVTKENTIKDVTKDITKDNKIDETLKEDKEALEQELKISVLSDIHYFSTSMIKDCDDFTTAKNRDRKLLEESSAILDSAFAKVKAESPDVLLITGDLTKDGEKLGHMEVAYKLKKLQEEFKEEGKELKIYVVNGNHDINNSDAEDFSSGKAVKALKTTPADFINIYKDFTFNEASAIFTPSNGEAGSLSYVVSPKEGYTFIGVDSCKYSSDSTSSGKNEHETDGAVSEELKDWIIEQASIAKEKGDTVILLQHHGIVPHFDEEPEILSEYLVDNYEAISKTYADAGIKYVFTGHMHSNDISKLTTEAGNDIYDIETGSAVTYPCPIRSVDFIREKEEDKVKESAKINSDLINNLNYIDKDTGKSIDNLKEYSYKNCIKPGFFITNAQDFVNSYLEQVKNLGGLKNYLSSKLGKDVGDYVIDSIKKTLPNDSQNALNIDGKAKVYYDALNARIVIKGVSFYSSGTLYITNDAIKKEIVDSMLSQMDTKILNNTDYVNTKVVPVVNDILNTKINCGNTGDKTISDLFNYVYLSNLAGNETTTSWVEAAAQNFKNTNNVNILLNVLSKDISSIVSENASNLTYDADKIVSKGSGLTSMIMRQVVVNMLGCNLQDIINLGKINVNDKVNGAMNIFINESKKEYYGNLAYRVIESMTIDTNYIEDNDTLIQ